MLQGEYEPFTASATGADPKRSDIVPVPLIAMQSPLYAAGRASVSEVENLELDEAIVAAAEKAPDAATEANEMVEVAGPSVAVAEPAMAQALGNEGAVLAVSVTPEMATSPSCVSARTAVSAQRVALDEQEEYEAVPEPDAFKPPAKAIETLERTADAVPQLLALS